VSTGGSDERPDGLTHFDSDGAARMVGVGGKEETLRTARARARISMRAETMSVIQSGTAKKGDVLGVARIAGIQAAKRTADLIPLCHPLRLTAVDITFLPADGGPAIEIEATVRAFDRTGVEMEAMTAASIAGLTIYDMCKAIDRSMTVERVQLLEKTGGQKGAWKRTTS